uniref:RRM domain-containing protein n=1 Tax=Bursaphelenchus xylophilus TaxID=6326 RepID=A0A1I7S7D8_BURXY
MEVQEKKLEAEPEKVSKNSHITETLKQFTSNMDNWADWAAEEDQEEEPQMSDHERELRNAAEGLKPPFLIYVSELSPQTTTEDIYFFFGGEDKVIEIYFHDDGYKNDALLELKDKEDLIKALLLTNTDIYRRKMLIEYVDPLSCKCVDIMRPEPIHGQESNLGRYNRRESQQQRNRVSNDVRASHANIRSDYTRYSNERNDDRNVEQANREWRGPPPPPVEPKPSGATKSNPFGKAKPVNIDYGAFIETQEKPHPHQKSRNEHKQNTSNAPSLLDVNVGGIPQHNRKRYESSTIDETESTTSTIRNKERENGRKPKGRYNNKNRNDGHFNRNKPEKTLSETGSVANYNRTKSSDSLVVEKRNAPDFSAITKHLTTSRKEKKNVGGNNEEKRERQETPSQIQDQPVQVDSQKEETHNQQNDNKDSTAPPTTATTSKNKKRNKKKNENVNANLKANKFHALNGIDDH